MYSILTILLCAAIVVSAIAAERSAKGSYRLRAVLLNLFGLACLGAGLLAIFAWSHRDAAISHRLAMVERGIHSAGSLVRLQVDNEGRVMPAASARTHLTVAEDAPPVTENVVTASTPSPDSATDVPGVDPSAEMPADEPPEQAAEATPEGAEVEGALPKELMPQVEIDYKARPAWVDREDRDEGPVHQVSVSSGPYLRQREARQELGRQLKSATDEYINEFLANSKAARWLGYDEARIRRTLVSARNIYDEKVISPSFGVMYQSHALLEFGPEFQRDVERAWHQIVARAQLAKLAMAAAAVLGTLVLLFSYFHADTATKGFYSGRLKFATGVAILGLVASGFLLARSIPWLWP